MPRFLSAHDLTSEEWEIVFEKYKAFNPGDVVEILVHPGNYKFGDRPHRIVNLVELYHNGHDIVYEVEDPEGKISRWSSTYIAPIGTFLDYE